jgi:hypothetical protein
MIGVSSNTLAPARVLRTFAHSSLHEKEFDSVAAHADRAAISAARVGGVVTLVSGIRVGYGVGTLNTFTSDTTISLVALADSRG